MIRKSRPWLVSLCFPLLLAACDKGPSTAFTNPPTEKAEGEDDAKLATGQTDPDRVGLELELANRFVNADESTEAIVRIKVSTIGKSDSSRPAANIALVLDTSSSMEGEAIVEARRAAGALLDSLDDGDRLAIVAFNSSTQVPVNSTLIDADSRKAVAKAIAKLEAKGSTDLYGGLRAGLSQVTSHHLAGGIQRIVLLSDGLPNDEGHIPDLARQAGASGVPITALGLGLDYQETLLGTVAEGSGGKLHFAEDATKVASVFQDEVLSFDRIVARSMVLELSAGPGVTIDEVAGQGTVPGRRATSMSLGDLVDGEEREVHVRLRLGPHAAGATVELLDAKLGFQDAIGRVGPQYRNEFIAAKAAETSAELEGGRSASVELTSARAFTASATIKIMQRARTGDLKGAIADLDRAEATAKAAAERYEDEELAGLTADLSKLRKTLPELVPPKPHRQPAMSKSRGKSKGKPKSKTKGRGNAKVIYEGAGSVQPSPEPFPASTAGDARHNRGAYTRAYDAVH